MYEATIFWAGHTCNEPVEVMILIETVNFELYLFDLV